LHPIEIKTTSDPTKTMIRAFRRLEDIPGMTLGEGAVVCMAKELLPLTEQVSIISPGLI
jgi:hypothetical protein